VVEIGLTSTSLLSPEKFPVIVPNSFFSSQVGLPFTLRRSVGPILLLCFFLSLTAYMHEFERALSVLNAQSFQINRVVICTNLSYKNENITRCKIPTACLLCIVESSI